jgi:hypothetical protein
MKNKKGRHRRAKHASPNETNGNAEGKMVTVYYKTGNHRHPIQYWMLMRYKNGNGE